MTELPGKDDRAVQSMLAMMDEIDQRLVAQNDPPKPPAPPNAPPGGDGGNMGGMDARVANLEIFAADAKERLTRVETKLDHIEKEISSAKWFVLGGVLTIIVTVITTIVATGIGVQQMTVTTFEAAGKANASSSAQPIIINVPPAAPTPAK
jgi:hypothetical protein